MNDFNAIVQCSFPKWIEEHKNLSPVIKCSQINYNYNDRFQAYNKIISKIELIDIVDLNISCGT